MLNKAVAPDNKNGGAHVNIALYYFDPTDYATALKHMPTAQAERQRRFSASASLAKTLA